MGGITYKVRTAMRTEIGSKGNAAHEEEEGVERICDDHEHGRHGEVLLYCGHDQVEQGEQPKHRHKHDVVHNRRVAAKGLCDHVASECHDEQRAEELEMVWCGQCCRVAVASACDEGTAYLQPPESEVDKGCHDAKVMRLLSEMEQQAIELYKSSMSAWRRWNENGNEDR